MINFDFIREILFQVIKFKLYNSISFFEIINYLKVILFYLP